MSFNLALSVDLGKAPADRQETAVTQKILASTPRDLHMPRGLQSAGQRMSLRRRHGHPLCRETWHSFAVVSPSPVKRGPIRNPQRVFRNYTIKSHVFSINNARPAARIGSVPTPLSSTAYSTMSVHGPIRLPPAKQCLSTTGGMTGIAGGTQSPFAAWPFT
jgi:hypothetical protein